MLTFGLRIRASHNATSPDGATFEIGVVVVLYSRRKQFYLGLQLPFGQQPFGNVTTSAVAYTPSP